MKERNTSLPSSHKRPKVALALGGGGARGFAHLGVLHVLEREGIPVDLIVGTSAGAIVGALYSLSPDIDELVHQISEHTRSENFRRSKIRRTPLQKSKGRISFFSAMTQAVKKRIAYQLLVTRQSLLKTERLEESIRSLLGDATFEDTRIPFHAATLDLVSGEEVLLSEGELVNALVASASLPGYFPPHPVGNKRLVDIGFVNSIPVTSAYDAGADIVIASVIGGNGSFPTVPEDATGIDVVLRVTSIAANFLEKQVLERASAIIRSDVRGTHWADFEGHYEYILKGRIAAERMVPDLKRLLADHSIELPGNSTNGHSLSNSGTRMPQTENGSHRWKAESKETKTS